MPAGSSDFDKATQQRCGKLSVGVVAPRHNGAVAFEGDTMAVAGTNLNDIRQSHRYGRLALVVVAPTDNRAVSAQSEGMSAACCDCDHAQGTRECWHCGNAGRNSSLPVGIIAPGKNGTISLQGHNMMSSSGDLYDVCCRSGHRQNRSGSSPDHDRACSGIGGAGQWHAVKKRCRCGDEDWCSGRKR